MPVTSIASTPMRELHNNNNKTRHMPDKDGPQDGEKDGAKKMAMEEDQYRPFTWQKPVPSKALRTSENYMLRYKCRKRPGGGKLGMMSFRRCPPVFRENVSTRIVCEERYYL